MLFRSMKRYGLDGVLVQRFVGTIPDKRATGDVVLKNVIAGAETYGRTFAIEYDISGGNPETFAQTIREDWKYLVNNLHVTASPNYQRHNGKPAVSVWGMGLDEPGHPPTDAATAKDLTQWFESKAQVTLDADGADLPSDWYLKLAGKITRMFHGEVAVTPQMPLH